QRPSTPKAERLPVPKSTTPQAEPTPQPGPAAEKPAATGGVTAMGTVQLVQTMTLSPAVTRLVVSIRAQAGATVKRGDLLIELDERREKLEFDRALAKFQPLKDKHEMLANMVKSGAAPTSEGKAAEMEFRVAQADVQLAELALQGTRIVAPMDGTILQWRVH